MSNQQQQKRQQQQNKSFNLSVSDDDNLSDGDHSTYHDDTRFRNKKIVITGAGGNFGREGCIYFVVYGGANVAAIDNNKQSLEETITIVNNLLLKKGKAGRGEIKGYDCDVTNSKLVDKTLNTIVNSTFFDGTGPDLLWNNAGYQGQIQSTLEYDVKDFCKVMDINVNGMFIVLQSVAKHMSSASMVIKEDDTKRGNDTQTANKQKFSIVNTASVAGLRGTPAMIR